MLESLHVKNLALIDEMEIYFEKGLNILTGETGAGKSIIIGSINLALGAKADKEMIRNGKDFAFIELIFSTENQQLLNRMEELDIPVEEGLITLSRRIMPTRSIGKINGETVSAKQLNEISQYIIDIHGQHEHQSLLQRKRQFELLDDFCEEQLGNLVHQLQKAYHKYQQILQKINEELVDDTQKEKELALASFELSEIDAANIVLGEDEKLEELYQKMVNSKKMMEALSEAYGLTGSESDEGASDSIGRALRQLNSVSAYDSNLEGLTKTLVEIENFLNDFNREMAHYISDMEFDQEDFIRTEERLDVLNHLKSKYGKTLEAVWVYKEELVEKVNRYADYDTYRQKMMIEFDQAKKALELLSDRAHKIREKCAVELSKKMKTALIDLNFLNVEFGIDVTQGEKYTAQGNDQVDFLISTNPGEPLKGLSSVASGGELSRIMLALKTVFAQKDAIDTLIFDEIDTGISGKTAWKVSEKLGILGKEHQVICITHLPQIAAMADTHFLIEKGVKDGSTVTNIHKMKEEESIIEMARMLGGETITDAVILNAKEMKELAANKK